METILEARIDKAFDKFTAWALRNSFDVPPELEIVMVSCHFYDLGERS
jgi:kinetochore protein Mis12/MTW1